MKKELIVVLLVCILIFSGCQQFNLNDKDEYNSTLIESNQPSETLSSEVNSNDMDADSETHSDYGIFVEGSFAGRSSDDSQILLNEGNKKLILKANLPIDYSKSLRPAKGIKKSISKDNLIAKVMSKGGKVEINDYALGTIYKKDNKMIDFRKDGDILIVERETTSDVEVLSEELAVDIAKKYLEEKLGMSNGLKLGRVRYACEEQVNLSDNSEVLEKDTKKIIAYIFEFTQDIDGVPMSLNAGGNRIQVKVDANGVVYSYINWDNIEFDFSEREKQIISCSQALDKVISYIRAAKNIDYNKEMTITNVALVYSNSLCEDKTNYIPVWEIIFEDGRIIHVDAFDGNVIDLTESSQPSEPLHSEVNSNGMDADSETHSDYGIFVEGFFAGRFREIEIMDDALARELLKVIRTRDELLPESYVWLYGGHDIKVVRNGSVIEEIYVSWPNEICCARYTDTKHLPSTRYLFKIPTDLALRIENYMLDNYLTLKGFHQLATPPIVISHERINKISIKSLIAGNDYFDNYEKDSSQDIIERFVNLYNQSLSIHDKWLKESYLTEREKDVLSGKLFDADYEIEVLFENGEKLELVAGNEKGIFRIMFRGEEYIVQNHELYMYLNALWNAETKKPDGKYLRVVTDCGEVLIYNNALAEEFYQAIKNEENHLKGTFNAIFGIYIQIKENGEIVDEFKISNLCYFGEYGYLAITTKGVNVNISPSIGEKLEDELRKHNYSLSYAG